PVPFSVSVTYTMQSAIEELSRYTTDQYNRLASGLPLYPLNLTILPENQCVTDCVYCYAERKPLKKEELLSFDRWKELIFEAHALGISLAVLSGGDPLTYSQIIPLLKCLLEHDFYFVLPSKLFISKSLAKTMADIGMSRAWNQVSIDAYTDATAFKMVGVHNYATRTFSSIVNMVEVGLQVRANCVLTPVNFREVVGLVKKLDSLGVKKISIAAYGRSHYRHNDNFFLSEEQMEWVNRNVGALKSTLRCADISCNLAQRDYSKNRDTAIPTKWDGRAKCSGGRSSIVITPTGKVTLCEQMPVEDEYIAGDLKQQSLLELWNSDRLNRMIYPDKAKFLGTVCEACQDFEVCVYEYGYCFRDALFSFGTIYAPPPNCPKAPQGIRMQ
ncbi:MAG: SPASM domain-containing protein, partial [Bacteroidales bacterium]